MNTPRLNKKLPQANKSSKKAPIKGLKNVLAQPYVTQWPTLNDGEGFCLEELLNRLLPELRRNTERVPWSHLRKMSKDERRVAKDKLCKDSEKNENDPAHLKTITLGINAITRDLEKGKLCSVLLDSGVEPLLIKHVITMAQNNDVSILSVPFLKKVTLHNMGFASAAVGLKHEAKESNHFFHQVYQEIVKFGRAEQSGKKVVSPEDTATIASTEDVEMLEEEKDSQKVPFSLATNIYKYRSSKKERIFVPQNLKEISAEKVEGSEDFIAIGKDDVDVAVKKFPTFRKQQRYMDLHGSSDGKKTHESAQSTSVVSANCRTETKSRNGTYLSLKVKRIQGNSNRVKATKLAKSKKKSSLNKNK